MGDISYRPLIEDFVWSYSRVSSFEDCPYKWFMKYISGDSEQPTFYASYGSFIHSLIERYYSGELKREELPMAFLLGFSAGVRGERPSDKIVRNYIAAGKRYFDKEWSLYNPAGELIGVFYSHTSMENYVKQNGLNASPSQLTKDGNSRGYYVIKKGQIGNCNDYP